MLHAERLTCIVDDRPLFAALTLSLAAGELLQVAGDNGAGEAAHENEGIHSHGNTSR